MSNIGVPVKLPPNVSFSAGEGLFWGEQRVGAFLPRLDSSIEVVRDGKSAVFVRMNFLFEDRTEGGTYMVPLSELERTDWFNLDSRCLVDPDCSRAGKYLAHIIKAALPAVPAIKEIHINRLGNHIIDGIPLFCTGDRLYWPPGKEVTNVILDSMPYKLIKGGYSEAEAVAKMMKVVNLTPDAGRMIFAHSLLYFQRSAFIGAGVTPCCVVFLVGKTGTQKTTYATFLNQIYNRHKGIERPPRFNSSPRSFEDILGEKSDCVVVLDDLFPADSRQTKRIQEKTLIDIVRIIGDDSGRARMDGKQVIKRSPSSGGLITGEYLIGTGSDAARLLPVTFTSPIDTLRLQECQNEPLVVSTFFHYYISWYIERYHEIQALLKKWLLESRQIALGVHDRLAETQFCIDSAYRLFLLYCTEKGFTSQENAQKEHRSFHTLLTNLVREQQKRVEQGQDNETDQIDYLTLISTWYRTKAFDLAKNANRLGNHHDGLVHKKLLCLRTKKLMQKINEVAPSVTLTDVRQVLVSKDALKLDAEGKGVKINQLRFYGIYLDKLKGGE